MKGIPVTYLSGVNIAQDILKMFLINTRNIFLKQQPYCSNTLYYIELFDYLLRYWDTSNRNIAFNYVIKAEQELGEKGVFFKELRMLSLMADKLNGVDGIKDKLKDFFIKIRNKILIKKYKSLSSTDDKDFNIESFLKTGRDILAKHKFKIASVVFIATSGIAIVSSKKLQQQLKLRK